MGNIRSRWPGRVKSCLCCETSGADVSYGKRGLCVPCLKVETDAGRMSQWGPLDRSPGKKRDKGNLYKVVVNIGITETSFRLKVSKEDVRMWLVEGEAPDHLEDTICEIRREIVSMTREANRGCRVREYFSYTLPAWLAYDGRTI